MVYRIYVEKKEGLQNEANSLLSEIKTFLGITTIEKVRILNRYENPRFNKTGIFFAIFGSILSAFTLCWQKH